MENFQRIDSFLSGVLDAMDWQETLLIVASDHGNVEDCSSRKHTENRALTLLIGGESGQYAERINSLEDFVDVITEFLGESLLGR